jgi:hypothetical protein
MKRVGIANIGAREFIRMKDHGVSPDFAAAVKKIEPNVSIDELVRMKDHGVSASYLQGHKNGRSIEEVIRLHDRGEEDEAKF